MEDADDELEAGTPSEDRFPKESYAEYLGIDKVPVSWLLALGVLLTASYFLSFRNEEQIRVLAAVWTASFWVVVAIVLIAKWRMRD